MNNLTTAFSRFQSAFNQIYPVVPGNKGQVDKITRNETKLERRKSQNPAPRLRRSITVNDFQDIQTVAQVMIFNKKLCYRFGQNFWPRNITNLSRRLLVLVNSLKAQTQ